MSSADDVSALTDHHFSKKRRRNLVDDNNHDQDDGEDVDDEFDLKVTVGGGDDYDDDDDDNDDEDDDDEGQKEFMYNSNVLAFYSGYIRTELSNQKSKLKELVFPDIKPSTWVKMFDFVSKPLKIRQMSVFDAMEVVKYYHGYEFKSGVELCDHVLANRVFDPARSKGRDYDSDNWRVYVAGLANDLKLTKTLEKAKDWILNICMDLSIPWNAEQVERLSPILGSDDDIISALRERLQVEELDRAFIESSVFPHFFVAQYQLTAAKKTTSIMINEIEISNCEICSGVYDRTENEYFKCELRSPIAYKGDKFTSWWLRKIEKEEVWDIVGVLAVPDGENETRPLHTCKSSQHSILPPNSGWVSLHEDLTKIPELRYFQKKEDGSRVEINVEEKE